VDEVKGQFAALLAEVDAGEIATLESGAHEEGMPPMEIKCGCATCMSPRVEEALNARASLAQPVPWPGRSARTTCYYGDMKAENVAGRSFV